MQSSKTKYGLSILIIILFVSMLSAGSSSQFFDTSISSSGLINYQSQTNLGALFGWAGMIRTYDSVVPLLNKLQADGWNAIRYISVPQWAQAIDYGDFDINYVILRHLIDEAKKRNMYIILNIAHNFPTGAFIDGHRDEWINEYIYDLEQINAFNCTNIIFDLANEYTGTQSNIIAHYNAMIQALRDPNYPSKTLKVAYNHPIYMNYWWNHNIEQCTRQVKDPINNFMVGMHCYAQSNNFDDYDTPGTFMEVCQDSGIENYFQNYLFPTKIQPVLDLGVKFCMGEVGSGWDYKYTRGGVAFPMRFLQLANERYPNIHVIAWRCDTRYSDYDEYYYYANQYWGMSYWIPPA